LARTLLIAYSSSLVGRPDCHAIGEGCKVIHRIPNELSQPCNSPRVLCATRARSFPPQRSVHDDAGSLPVCVRTAFVCVPKSPLSWNESSIRTFFHSCPSPHWAARAPSPPVGAPVDLGRPLPRATPFSFSSVSVAVAAHAQRVPCGVPRAQIERRPS
jgi:hypothetical protein